jgi:hypothetical protein
MLSFAAAPTIIRLGPGRTIDDPIAHTLMLLARSGRAFKQADVRVQNSAVSHAPLHSALQSTRMPPPQAFAPLGRLLLRRAIKRQQSLVARLAVFAVFPPAYGRWPLTRPAADDPLAVYSCERLCGCLPPAGPCCEARASLPDAVMTRGSVPVMATAGGWIFR